MIDALAAEEANLLHARTLARRHGRWRDAMGCMQGLRSLYQHLGRGAEWARLVGELVPDLVDPTTDRPLPDREDLWSLVAEYRVRIAREARDWAGAERLQNTCVAWDRDRAADALTVDPDQLDDAQRYRIRTLAVSLEALGNIQREQERADCVEQYQRAADLYRRIGASREEGIGAFNLVRKTALDRTPGFAWLRMEIADDVGLGKMIVDAGGHGPW